MHELRYADNASLFFKLVEEDCEVNTVTRDGVFVPAGHYLIGTGRPNVYDILSPEAFDVYHDLVFKAKDVEIESDVFDPSAHTVKEVLDYLSDPATTENERARVYDEESRNKARTGIVG